MAASGPAPCAGRRAPCLRSARTGGPRPTCLQHRRCPSRSTSLQMRRGRLRPLRRRARRRPRPPPPPPRPRPPRPPADPADGVGSSRTCSTGASRTAARPHTTPSIPTTLLLQLRQPRSPRRALVRLRHPRRRRGLGVGRRGTAAAAAAGGGRRTSGCTRRGAPRPRRCVAGRRCRTVRACYSSAASGSATAAATALCTASPGDSTPPPPSPPGRDSRPAPAQASVGGGIAGRLRVLCQCGGGSVQWLINPL